MFYIKGATTDVVEIYMYYYLVPFRKLSTLLSDI